MTFDLPSQPSVEQTVLILQAHSEDFAALLLRYGAPAPALRHFGLIHWQAGHFDRAAEAFLAALSLTPSDPHLWTDLASVYDNLSEIERGEYCIRRAIEHDPSRSQSWLMLAGIVGRRGDPIGAEAAYRTAIEIEPALADAHFGLGILYFSQRRLAEAIISLRRTIDHAPGHALAWTCLGHGLFATGEFAASSAAFEGASRLGTTDLNSRLKHARARTFEAMIGGRIEEALAAYPDLLGAEAEDIETISRDAFGMLSAFGHQTAAIDIGRRRLMLKPDDPIQRYLLAAVEGRRHSAAPLDYVESYFDRFAPEFDHKLVDILRYRVPERLKALVARHRERFNHMLDLGCGTGLSADHLAAFGGRLAGVDISGRMLDEARRRERYAELVKAEAVSFLRDRPGSFDLVFAADLLIYLGDLEPLMRALAASIVAGGLVALSIETGASEDFELLPSGRFAHSPLYVRRLAGLDFDRLDEVETMIRLEANRPVDGRLFVLRRR